MHVAGHRLSPDSTAWPRCYASCTALALRLGDVDRADGFNPERRPRRIVQVHLLAQLISGPLLARGRDLGDQRVAFILAEPRCPETRPSRYMHLGRTHPMNVASRDIEITAPGFIVRKRRPPAVSKEVFKIAQANGENQRIPTTVAALPIIPCIPARDLAVRGELSCRLDGFPKSRSTHLGNRPLAPNSP
jgi:hypothetical protein